MARILLFGCSLLFLTACITSREGGAIAGAAGDALGSVAPLLPPPFGVIAGVVATALAGVASIGANKVSNTKRQKKETAPMLVKLMTDHSSTIFTSIVPLIAILKAAGALPISDGELASIATTFAAPVVTKKVMRKS